MLATIIISLIVMLILFFVYREYRNEKQYQETRKQKKRTPPNVSKPQVKRTPAQSKPKPKPSPYRPQSSTQERVKPEPSKSAPQTAQKADKQTDKKVTTESLKPKEVAKTVTPEKVKEEEQAQKSVTLPRCQYPKFSHERLVGMGFSETEAKAYVAELITQIETEMPQLKAAIEAQDFEKMDHITHSIKGSSSTIGSGGISDLINEFNHYVQTGKEKRVAEAYFKHLQHYYTELKAQYPA